MKRFQTLLSVSTCADTAGLAAARTVWRLLFGPAVELPDFATDGGTAIDLVAAAAMEAETMEAARIVSEGLERDAEVVTKRPQVGRLDVPGGSERWRVLRVMRDEKEKHNAAAAASNGEVTGFEGEGEGEGERDKGEGNPSNTGGPRGLTAPLAATAPPPLTAAAHQAVRLMVLLVRRSWPGGDGARGGGSVSGPLDAMRVGDDDATAAASLLEQLAYDTLSLGAVEHSFAGHSQISHTAVTANATVLAGGGSGASWGLGWVRAMGLIAPADAQAAAATPSGSSNSVAAGVVSVLPPLPASLGAAPPIFMTPANGVRPLVGMLRGGTDPTVVMSLRPAFQALSLRTKLAVAEGGAHDELMALIGRVVQVYPGFTAPGSSA